MKKSRVLFKNQWFDVREKDGILTHEFPDWVNVVALTSSNQVVLEKQFRQGMRIVTIETPSGSIEKKDGKAWPRADERTATQAAKRELFEETGFEPKKIIYLGKSQANPNLMNNFIHHFLFFDCKPGKKHQPEDDLEWFLQDFQETLQQVRNGMIQHAYTIEGLMRAADYINTLTP